MDVTLNNVLDVSPQNVMIFKFNICVMAVKLHNVMDVTLQYVMEVTLQYVIYVISQYVVAVAYQVLMTVRLAIRL